MKVSVVLFVLVSLIVLSSTFPTENEDVCDCPTTFEYEPVCGTDGNTHPNEGSVYCINQCYGQEINILYSGRCEGD